MDNLTRENIDRFNAIAAEWDIDPRRAMTAGVVAQAMLQAVTPRGDEQALEFGCGTGMVTLTLAPYVKRFVAQDSSPEMLARLQEKVRQLGVTNVEIHEGALPDRAPAGRFDLIFSSMTLHHIADTSRLLASLFDLLQPGGRIALADLDREDGSFHGDKPGIAHHGFERSQLERQLLDAGFEQVRFTTPHVMEKQGDDGVIRRYPLFLASATRPRGRRHAAM